MEPPMKSPRVIQAKERIWTTRRWKKKIKSFEELYKEDKWEAIRQAQPLMVELGILNKDQPLSDILDIPLDDE